MKKIIITLALFAAVQFVHAQAPQKVMPAKINIVLTDREFIRVDSMVNALYGKLLNSNVPSGEVQATQKKLGEVFSPLYQQLNAQMVAVPDTTKKAIVPVKKK